MTERQQNALFIACIICAFAATSLACAVLGLMLRLIVNAIGGGQ